jgi:hypothetical protein
MVVPEYAEVKVVYRSALAIVWGIWTSTVPVCPGRLGTATVDVATVVPE